MRVASASLDRLEQDIAHLWAETLLVSQVQVEENFFDLGGNSIAGFKIATRLRERFGLTVSVATVFAFPTVRELALHVREVLSQENPPSLSSSTL